MVMSKMGELNIGKVYSIALRNGSASLGDVYLIKTLNDQGLASDFDSCLMRIGTDNVIATVECNVRGLIYTSPEEQKWIDDNNIK